MAPREPSTIFNKKAFAGRVFGVTGAAHGIGAAIVTQLAQLGAFTVILDLDKPRLEALQKRLAQSGAPPLGFAGDITSAALLRRAVRTTEQRWGRLDGWVNNATVNLNQKLPEQRPEEFTRTWEVNTLASWQACQLAAPLMARTGGGSIVNISSVMAHFAGPHSAAYSSAKAALEGLTTALAVELARQRIRVNAIEPGHIDTAYELPRPREPIPDAVWARYLHLRQELHRLVSRGHQPYPRGGEPNDIAGAVLFLLSDAAEFVSGAMLRVDGAGRSLLQSRAQPDPEIQAYEKQLDELIARYPALKIRYARPVILRELMAGRASRNKRRRVKAAR